MAVLLLVAITFAVVAAAGCGREDEDAPPPTAMAAVTENPVTLRGSLTLDGAPLEAEFLGARVLRDGLVGACQLEIPAVVAGRYEIDVASDARVRGCGAPGADVLLWTFVGEKYLLSTTTVPWPEGGSIATFDAAFSSDAPEGASRPVTEFKGRLFAADGTQLSAGTVVEAYAGDVRCAVTSLRPAEETEGFYTLIVAGPESVSRCVADATLTFRLDGKPAVETAIHDLGGSAAGHELNLTQR